jgi:hypothetical protein
VGPSYSQLRECEIRVLRDIGAKRQILMDSFRSLLNDAVLLATCTVSKLNFVKQVILSATSTRKFNLPNAKNDSFSYKKVYLSIYLYIYICNINSENAYIYIRIFTCSVKQ